jgi:hypothetical protein
MPDVGVSSNLSHSNHTFFIRKYFIGNLWDHFPYISVIYEVCFGTNRFLLWVCYSPYSQWYNIQSKKLLLQFLRLSSFFFVDWLYNAACGIGFCFGQGWKIKQLEINHFFWHAWHIIRHIRLKCNRPRNSIPYPMYSTQMFHPGYWSQLISIGLFQFRVNYVSVHFELFVWFIRSDFSLASMLLIQPISALY